MCLCAFFTCWLAHRQAGHIGSEQDRLTDIFYVLVFVYMTLGCADAIRNLAESYLICMTYADQKEGRNVLFYDTLNTFIFNLWLCGVGHMVKDRERKPAAATWTTPSD